MILKHQMLSAAQICYTVPAAKWKYQARVTINTKSAKWSSLTTIALPVFDTRFESSGKWVGTILFRGKSRYQRVTLGMMSIFIFVTLQTIYRELIRLITGKVMIMT